MYSWIQDCFLPKGSYVYPSSVFSCDQAALQMVFSVCLSVCPSVCLSVCVLVQAPSRAGFCTGNWSSLSLTGQTCIMLWVCSYWKMSVCRLSVTPFWLCSHHHIITKFSGVITYDHAKGQGQRSKVKVTEVTTQLNRFRTVTPVLIHIWWWNDAYSLMLLRRGALLFFKVIRQISRSHGSKYRWIRPRLGVSGL